MKLSVVCLTYNHEKYIADAVDGFLMQETTFPIEIIVADDCSTDGTLSILKKYSDPRLKIISRPKNLGAKKNFLDVISRMKGEYMALCDGDDYWTVPLKLQKQVDYLEANKDCSMCFHPVKMFLEDDKSKNCDFPNPTHHPFVFEGKTNLENIVQQNYIQANSVVYRWRSDAAKGIEKIMPGDHYLHIRHAEKGKIGFIDEVMGEYRRHSESVWFDTESAEFWAKIGIKHLELFRYMDNTYHFSYQYEDALFRVCLNIVNAAIKLQDKNLLDKVKELYPDQIEKLFTKETE